MVKWRLCLRHPSPRPYELLCCSGCIQLPSQCLLHDYTYSCCKFSWVLHGNGSAVDGRFPRSKISRSMFVSLVTRYKSEKILCMPRHMVNLVGFVNLVNEYPIQLEQDLPQAMSASPALASSVCVFMLRCTMMFSSSF